uniref:Putative secreted protein n=1 Tax=Anopheles triannulatus TaxID=58253 RepID=A0A2M4B4U9_9DIPT
MLRFLQVRGQHLLQLLYLLMRDAFGDETEYHEDVTDAGEEPEDDKHLVHGEQRAKLVLLRWLERGGKVPETDRRQRDERVVDGHIVRPLLEVAKHARRRKDEHDHARYKVQYDLADQIELTGHVAGVGRELVRLVPLVQPDKPARKELSHVGKEEPIHGQPDEGVEDEKDPTEGVVR